MNKYIGHETQVYGVEEHRLDAGGADVHTQIAA